MSSDIVYLIPCDMEEKFSAKQRKENSEKKRDDLSSLVLNRELLFPYDEQKKDEIRANTIAAINAAYTDGDYAKVGELQRLLLAYFGKETAAKREESPMYVTNEPHEHKDEINRAELDLRALVKEYDFENEIAILKSKRSHDPYDFVVRAGQLRQFDSIRFDAKVEKINDSEWKKVADKSRTLFRSGPIVHAIILATALKRLDKDRFENEHIFDNNAWEETEKMFKEWKDAPPGYLFSLLSPLVAFDAEKTKNNFSLTQEQWKKMLSVPMLETHHYRIIEDVHLYTILQQMKPEGVEASTEITEDVWKKTLEVLQHSSKYGVSNYFFEFFEIVKNLKIKK